MKPRPLQLALQWAALLTAALLPRAARAQETPDLGQLAEFIRWGGVLFSLPAIAIALLFLKVVENTGDRLSERFADRRPTILLLQSAVRFGVYFATIALTVSLSIRLDSTALTVIGGALAFAIGFAMRDLVAALIAGITIMFDRPFQVGDRVHYAGQYGDIIKIGLRSVRMNTLDDNVVTIPNNKVLTDVTVASTYGSIEMQVAMDFYIGADQDARRARELILEACLTSPYVFLRRPVSILAKQALLQECVAVHLKARPYVFDSKYEKAFETDVHLRVLDAFRDHGIEPPALLLRQQAGPRGGAEPGEAEAPPRR